MQTDHIHTTHVLIDNPVAEPADQPLPPAEVIDLMRSSSLAALSPVDAGIAMMREAYKGKIYEVAIASGLDEAKKARADIRQHRYKVPHIVKAKHAELAQIGADLSTEGQRIVDALLELETPIDAQIKAEEKRREEEKELRDTKKREAQKLIDDAIAELTGLPAKMAGKSSETIAGSIDWAGAFEVSLEVFGDDAGRVAQAKNAALERLNAMHSSMLIHEQAQLALAADRAELERQQAEASAKAKQEQDQLEAQRRQNEAALAAQRAELEKIQTETLQRQAEVARAEKEQRDQRELIERNRKERADGVANRIALIKAEFSGNAGFHSKVIEASIGYLCDLDCSSKAFDDRAEEANAAREASLEALKSEHAKALNRERIKAEQEEADARELLAAQARDAVAQRKRDASEALYAALAGLLGSTEIKHDGLSASAQELFRNAEAALALVEPCEA